MGEFGKRGRYVARFRLANNLAFAWSSVYQRRDGGRLNRITKQKARHLVFNHRRKQCHCRRVRRAHHVEPIGTAALSHQPFAQLFSTLSSARAAVENNPASIGVVCADLQPGFPRPSHVQPQPIFMPPRQGRYSTYIRLLSLVGRNSQYSIDLASFTQPDNRSRKQPGLETRCVHPPYITPCFMRTSCVLQRGGHPPNTPRRVTRLHACAFARRFGGH